MKVWFNSLKISTKIAMFGFFATLITVFISIMLILDIKLMHKNSEILYQDGVSSIKRLKVISDMYAINIVGTAHKVRSKNISWENGLDNLFKAEEEIKKEFEFFEAQSLTEANKELFNASKASALKGIDFLQKIEGVFKTKDELLLGELIDKELYLKIDPISENISKLIEKQIEISEAVHSVSAKKYVENRNFISIVLTISIILQIIFGVIIIKNIKKELNNFSKLFEKLSLGDLREKYELQFGN